MAEKTETALYAAAVAMINDLKIQLAYKEKRRAYWQHEAEVQHARAEALSPQPGQAGKELAKDGERGKE